MHTYDPGIEAQARNAINFRYHKPHGVEQTNRYADVRQCLHNAADFLLTKCPPSEELSIALTRLQEVMFWANASIARNETAAFVSDTSIPPTKE